MKRLVLFLLFSTLLLGQEVKRPTAEADDSSTGVCSGGTRQASSAMPNFYDSDPNTFSSQSVSGGIASDQWKERKFTTWAAASGSYSSLNLKIKTACTITANSSDAFCGVQYSTNGGSTWSTVSGRYTDVTWATATDTVSLSAAQDLSQLQVRICVQGLTDPVNPGSAQLDGYDIRTEGVLVAKRKAQTIVVQ